MRTSFILNAASVYARVRTFYSCVFCYLEEFALYAKAPFRRQIWPVRRGDGCRRRPLVSVRPTASLQLLYEEFSSEMRFSFHSPPVSATPSNSAGLRNAASAVSERNSVGSFTGPPNECACAWLQPVPVRVGDGVGTLGKLDGYRGWRWN